MTVKDIVDEGMYWMYTGAFHPWWAICVFKSAQSGEMLAWPTIHPAPIPLDHFISEFRSRTVVPIPRPEYAASLRWEIVEWDEKFDWPEVHKLTDGTKTFGWVTPDDFGRGYRPWRADKTPISFPPSSLEETKKWLQENIGNLH